LTDESLVAELDFDVSIVTGAVKTWVCDRRSSTREGKDSNCPGAIRLGAVLPFPVAGGTSALEIVAGSHSELLASGEEVNGSVVKTLVLKCTGDVGTFATNGTACAGRQFEEGVEILYRLVRCIAIAGEGSLGAIDGQRRSSFTALVREFDSMLLCHSSSSEKGESSEDGVASVHA